MTASSSTVSPSLGESVSPIATWWHTIFLVAFVLGFSTYPATRLIAYGLTFSSRIPLYAMIISFDLFLFFYVWLLALRPRGIRVRDVIGGRWSSFGAFFGDIGTALLFWIVVLVVLAITRFLIHYSGIGAARFLVPRSSPEMAMFVAVSTTAGFCEEFVFRGYLQRQILALTQKTWAAISFQALIFGIGHAYQGWRGVVAITIYGGLFGVLANQRKSLRPGMMQHAAQDSIFGVVNGLFIRHGLISMLR